MKTLVKSSPWIAITVIPFDFAVILQSGVNRFSETLSLAATLLEFHKFAKIRGINGCTFCVGLQGKYIWVFDINFSLIPPPVLTDGQQRDPIRVSFFSFGCTEPSKWLSSCTWLILRTRDDRANREYFATTLKI